jgi:hypothetical protein
MAGVIDRDLGFKKFVGRIKSMGDLELVVGITKGEIATYAAANEYGTATIPSRPFMRSTIDDNATKYSQLVQRQMSRAITGKLTDKGAMIKVGNEVRNDLIKAIVGWTTPPNAESTQRRKGRGVGRRDKKGRFVKRGKGVDNPLVDTGTMSKSITFEVRAKGQTRRG